MGLFEVAIAMLFAGALLSAVARRLRVPYPALLALAGAGVALLPGLPSVVLDPHVALTLFVAPVLLDAAFDSSPRDLRENWREVVGLALGAVVVTVAAVAVVARWLVPQMPWATAVALGALVAPPDAAAATAVLKQLRPPHRLLVILEGESLFNDASALLIYRMAVAAVAGSFSGWGAIPMSLGVAGGSVLAGWVLSRVSIFMNDKLRDLATAVIVQFMSAFLVWMLAEWLHLSGIITVVVFAILVARVVPGRTPARMRIPSYAVWEVAVFVLNVLAFILVGLQLKPILAGLDRARLLEYAGTAVAITATVILVRIAWVMGYAGVARLLRQVLGGRLRRAPTYASFRAAAAMSWCGMRGIVTLAAALALPRDFPQRDLVLFCAFAVVLGTLVLQGGTLSTLLRLLRLEDDDTVEREVRRARVETARAGLAALSHPPSSETLDLLRRKYQARLRQVETAEGGAALADGQPSEMREYGRALQAAQAAERSTLVELRARGEIGDDAFHKVEEELDWAELNAEGLARAE